MAFVSYASQGKGYPYHRYPLIALLLVAMERDFIESCGLSGNPPPRARLIAGFALLFQCLYVAPHAALLVHSFSPATPFQDGLSAELKKLGPNLSGQVQCLDTFGGCINTLYDLSLVQSSGYLYDCYLFTAKQNLVSVTYREGFWRAYTGSRPKVVVLTDQFCFGGSDGFARLNNWPLLKNDLASNYVEKVDWQTKARQHWWSRPEPSAAFRIYVRK